MFDINSSHYESNVMLTQCDSLLYRADMSQMKPAAAAQQHKDVTASGGASEGGDVDNPGKPRLHPHINLHSTHT